MTLQIIEKYFKENGYPNEDVEIAPGVYVLCKNAEFFVSQTLNCLRAHSGNKGYMCYFNHLVNYYKAII